MDPHDSYSFFPPGLGPDDGPPLLEDTQNFDQFGNELPTFTEALVCRFNHGLSDHDWSRYGSLAVQDLGYSTLQVQPADTATNLSFSTMQAQPASIVTNAGFSVVQAQPANLGYSSLQAQPANLSYSSLQAQPTNLGYSSLQAQPANLGFSTLQVQPANNTTNAGFSTLHAAQSANTMTSVGLSTLQAQPAYTVINSGISALSISQDSVPEVHLTGYVGASVLPADLQQAQDNAVAEMPQPSTTPPFYQSRKHFYFSIIVLNNHTF